MSQQPTTPVKVPSSAASYSEATLDPDLRSQINTILLREGHVTKIQDRLLHTLNSNGADWPTAIQSHALTLLRSGEVLTFPALLRRVLEDIHEASATSSATTNGKKQTNGDSSKSAGAVNGTSSSETSALAVPQSVVDEALRVTKECLESVCEIEDSGTGA